MCQAVTCQTKTHPGRTVHQPRKKRVVVASTLERADVVSSHCCCVFTAVTTLSAWSQCGGLTAACGPFTRPCLDAEWVGTRCPQGHTCWRENSWWWSCQPGCPPGQGLTNGVCRTCSTNTYSPAFGTICTPCPPGQIAAPGSMSCVCDPQLFSDCAACSATSCTTCAPGFRPIYRLGGVMTCHPDIGVCSPSFGIRQDVLPNVVCAKCPAGTVSGGGRAAPCVNCGANQQPNPSQTACGECQQHNHDEKIGGSD